MLFLLTCDIFLNCLMISKCLIVSVYIAVKIEYVLLFYYPDRSIENLSYNFREQYCVFRAIFLSNHRYLSRSAYRCYAVKQAIVVFFNHDVKWFSAFLSRSKSTFRLFAIYQVALRSFQGLSYRNVRDRITVKTETLWSNIFSDSYMIRSSMYTKAYFTKFRFSDREFRMRKHS